MQVGAGFVYTAPAAAAGGGTVDAENGCSIEGGKVVLGNAPGAPGNPAQLIDSRFIYTNGQALYLIDETGIAMEYTLLSGDTIQMMAGPSGRVRFSMETAVGDCSFGVSVQQGSNAVSIQTGPSLSRTFATINQVNGNIQLGSNLIFNDVKCQVGGALTAFIYVKNMDASPFFPQSLGNEGYLFVNDGSIGGIVFQLPNINDGDLIGTHMYLLDATGDGIQVNAFTGIGTQQIINSGDIGTGIENTGIAGSSVHLVCISNSKWVVLNTEGPMWSTF